MESKMPGLAEQLLRYFVQIKDKECFAACLFTCYELIASDIVVELAWRAGFMEFAMPYMVQCMKDTQSKLDMVVKKTEDIQKKEEKKEEDTSKQMPPIFIDMLNAQPGLPPADYGGGGFNTMGGMGMGGMGMGMGGVPPGMGTNYPQGGGFM